MKRIDVVSAIVHDADGNLLIVKNVKGDSFYWGLPGGAVEPGETLEQAVVREVQEETGLTVSTTGLSSLREAFFEEPQHHVLFVTFFAEAEGVELCICDPDHEIADVRWVDADTAKDLMGEWYGQLRLAAPSEQRQAFYAFEGTR